MYALTVLPFWIYCIHTHRRWLGLLLLATLLLTASTTALLGIVLYVAYRLLRFGPGDRVAVAGALALGAGALAILAGNEFASDAFKKIVLSKLSLESFSGSVRLANFQASIDAFSGAPLLTQLFGFGFGYARSADMLSTILINLGAVGLAATVAVFFYPVVALRGGYREEGLRAAQIVLFVTLMVSVPEFSYLSIWLFLGMAYRQLDLQRERRRADAPPDLRLATGAT
jgi:hypothetical protein